MPTDHSAPIYEHGPRVPGVIVWLPSGMFVFTLGMWPLEGVLDGRGVLIAAAGALLLGSLIAALLLPRTYKAVRIDEAGLHVAGERVLPAERIGRIQILDKGDARTTSWALSRGRGTRNKERQNLYGGAFGRGPGVGVQQLDADGHWESTWLLPTDDLDATIAALEFAAHAGPRPDR